VTFTLVYRIISAIDPPAASSAQPSLALPPAGGALHLDAAPYCKYPRLGGIHVPRFVSAAAGGGTVKKVYVAQSPAEAHLVRGRLENEGIPAVVLGEDVYAIRGGVPLDSSTLPTVWVRDEDFERAWELLATPEES
jgi:hypothetical protein